MRQGDRRQDVLAAVEADQIQQPAEMDGRLHRPAAQLQVKLAGFRPQGVEDAFHVARPRPLPQLQGCQLVFRLADPLTTLVAAHVAGHFAALMDHPDLAWRWPARARSGVPPPAGPNSDCRRTRTAPAG